MMKVQLDTLGAEAIKIRQEDLMKEQLQYLQQHSPYYQRFFHQHGIDISTIQKLEDLQQIPVTTKDDLQQFNEDFFCVPKAAVADFVTTSGTLGKPVTFILTNDDLQRLALNEASSLELTGCTSNDIVQLVCTMDKRFMAGLAYYLGTQRIGAGIIRVGAGEPALQWDSVHRFSPTILITVPSFLLKMLDYADNNGIDYRNCSIQKVLCIGEPIRQNDLSLNTLGRRLKEYLDVAYYSTYASTEMSSAFTECNAHQGGHELPELIITELLNENDQPVPEGEPGEVTITTLGVEGMPLLRFKTGDICHYHNSPCTCGRNSKRLGPILGRRQQMIKLKGTTIYPEMIYNAINDIKHIDNYLVELATNDLGTDELTIKLGIRDHMAGDSGQLAAHFKSTLRVSPKIELTTPDAIRKVQFANGSRKPIKLIDKRNTPHP